MTADDCRNTSMLVFRAPASLSERKAALGLLGRRGEAEAVRSYVLADIGRPPGARPEAAVMVAPAEASWRVVGFGGDPRHCGRVAAELIRAATTAGARQLVAAPDAPPLVRKLLHCSPIRPVLRAAWTVVDL